MEEAVLLQQLRPAFHRNRAGAARQLRQLGADQVHKALSANIGVDALDYGCEFGVGFVHNATPYILMRSGGRSARTAQAISASASLRGSARSRPERKARQNICAGPMSWLTNITGVIGKSSPRATSGARQRSMPSASRAFCARWASRTSSLHSPREISKRYRASRRLNTTQSRWERIR